MNCPLHMVEQCTVIMYYITPVLFDISPINYIIIITILLKTKHFLLISVPIGGGGIIIMYRR
jgi:hypothetical protein